MSGFEPRFFSSGDIEYSEKNNNDKQITVGDFNLFFIVFILAILSGLLLTSCIHHYDKKNNKIRPSS